MSPPENSCLTNRWLDDNRRTGNHCIGLHYAVHLDIGLVISAVLVDESLVRNIGGSDSWDSLYTARVLLRVVDRGAARR